MEQLFSGGDTMARKQSDDNGLQELKSALRAKEPERLYIFHGEEKFLLHHYFNQLKNLLLDDLTESFNYHKFNSENFSIQSLVL